MGDQKRKSKRRSRSKPQKLLKGFTLYLCHNVDYDEVVEILHRHGFRYQRHRWHFSGSVEDTVLMRKIGPRRWILITADQKQRTRVLERKMIEHFRIRQFVFTSGEIGNVGALLVKAKNAMRNLCKRNEGPFVASISKSGNVALRTLGGSEETINQ